MQKKLENKFLPKYEVEDGMLVNEYQRNIDSLEINMQQALLIDKI